MKQIPVYVNPADLLILLEDDGEIYDLRNDFTCTKFAFQKNDLKFLFKADVVKDKKPYEIKLIFRSCVISNFDFDFYQLEKFTGFTFNILFRDRIEQSGTLVDELSNGKKAYRIAFNECEIELCADAVVALLNGEG